MNKLFLKAHCFLCNLASVSITSWCWLAEECKEEQEGFDLLWTEHTVNATLCKHWVLRWRHFSLTALRRGSRTACIVYGRDWHFCNGPENKYFRLCRDHATLLGKSSHRQVLSGVGLCSNKTLVTKRELGRVWPAGCSFQGPWSVHTHMADHVPAAGWLTAWALVLERPGFKF